MNTIGAKLPLHNRLLFFIASLLLFVLVFHTYVHTPMKLHMLELQTTYQMITRKNMILQDFAKKNPDISQHLAEIGKKTALVDALLPNQTDISGFLIQLEQAANASKLRLSEVKPVQPVIKTGYQEIPVEIIVKGSYVQILDFLQKIENMARFTTVSNISIQSRQGVLDSKMNIVVYSFGVPSGAQGQVQGQSVEHMN